MLEKHGSRRVAKSVEAYLDKRGKLHRHPTDAIVEDLASALGRVGDQTGMAEGVARVILAKRKEIEQAFRELDELVHHTDGNVEIADENLARVIRMSRTQGIDA